MTPYTLGVDFGTTKVACVLVDLDNGLIVNTVSKNTDAYVLLDNPLYYEQDLRKVHSAFIDAVSRCMREFEGEILSIGPTGQMHGIVGG